jgi:protein MpaA
LVPDGVSAYVVPIANPDGWERGTRSNANDVDLNRNFPWWFQYSDGGPAAASEPETNALMALVARLRPTLTIWIHQPLEYVAAIDPAARGYAEAWAGAAGLPVVPWLSQHGGGESWTYYALGLPSILVEGTTRQASPQETYAHRAGFEAVLARL